MTGIRSLFHLYDHTNMKLFELFDSKQGNKDISRFYLCKYNFRTRAQTMYDCMVHSKHSQNTCQRSKFRFNKT